MSKQLQTNVIIGGKVASSYINAFNFANSVAAKSAMKIQKSATGATNQFVNNIAGKVVGKVANTIKIASIAGGAALGALGIKGTMLASDLTEVQNVVDTAFGKNSSQINEWSKSAQKNFGLAELQAKQFTGTMGAMLKSSGISGQNVVSMSENLAGLAGDFASFYNLKHEETWEKIRSGISGETEPLKQLGINMNVANLEAFAMSKGIKTAYKDMDQAAQVALRYSYLLEVSKDAQGDFIKTQKSFANQLRIFQNNFSGKLAEISKKVLPVLETKLFDVNAVIDKVATPERIEQFGNLFAWAIQSGIDTISNLVSFVQQNWPTIQKSLSTTAEIGGDILNISKDIFNFVSQNWPLISTVIWGIVIATNAWVLSMKAAAIIETVTKGLQAFWLVTSLVKSWTDLMTLAQWGLNAAFAANPVFWVIAGITALIAIGVLLYKNWDAVTSALKRGWEWFQNLITGMPDVALALTGPLAPLLLLIKHFDQVKSAVSGAFSAVKNFFGFGGNGDKQQLAQQASKVNVPKFATGGTLTSPTFGLIAEAGYAETIVPHTSTPRSRALLAEAAAGIGTSLGNVFHIAFAPVIYGGVPAEIRKALDDAFVDFQIKIEQYFRDKERASYG